MPRLLALLAIVAAVPAVSQAQAWPGGGLVAVGTVRASAPPRLALPAAVTPAPDPTARAHRPLKLKARTALDAADSPPEVEVRARSEWSDDQGFRASPTRVSYKLRF